MKEQITAQQAKALVTATGWKAIRRGYIANGFDRSLPPAYGMVWQVWGCQGIYYRQRQDPMW